MAEIERAITCTTKELLARHGPLIGGLELAKILSFKNMAAFRQALRRGTIPVRVFELPGRRGKFALTQDLVAWLSSLESS
jgi:hypothetical protein